MQDIEDKANPKEANRNTTTVGEPPVWERDGRGLADVLKAFTLLKQDFNKKFYKV